MKPRVSVITTVKNEKQSIRKLILSLVYQTYKPTEIIIVDGGSTDGTWEIIQKLRKKYPKIIKPYKKPGFNISMGRNFAIEKAKSSLIASIDGGCYADKKWLENLVKRWIETRGDVIAGVFKPWIESYRDEIEGYIQCPDVRKLKDGWEPSSRSVLFTKEVWKKVGGYPIHLYTAEDTLFNVKLKKIGARFYLAKDAIVYWRMRKSVSAIFIQFYKYGQGDAVAGTWGFGKKKIFLQLSPLLLLPIILFDSMRVFSKMRTCTSLMYSLLFSASKRLGYIVGFFASLIRKGV